MPIRIDGDNATATPGITGGDADTGLVFGTDEVSIVTGGTEHVNVNATGDVDLGGLTVSGSAPNDSVNVDSSGRLLVGTSSASGNLTIAAQGNSGSTTGPAYVQLRRGALPLNTQSLGWIEFADNSSNVGARIYANASQNWVSGSAHGSDLLFSTTADGASSPTERMRIAQNGAFDCYTDSNEGFSVRTSAGAGTGAYIYQGFRSASSTSSGTVVYRVYSNGSYATISDATQKKNIETTRDGYLEDLNALRVVKYHWNEQDDSEQKELGLIAQEVETVFPGLVDQFDPGEGEPVKGVKNSVLTFMLIKALQEASAKIQTLEAKVAALEANP